MRELLEYILSELLEKGDYKIDEENNDGFSNFVVKADKEVIGLIIGKNGKTIRAIRNLLRVRATLNGSAVNLSVVEAD